ncbi:MAG: hypothetical protein GKS05_12915 [Nitrospirales bacterium]|nr:hypothetical protein [Nitrospirales bacterium]
MVAQTCPESLIRESIELLEPREHQFIDEIIRRLELFREAWRTQSEDVSHRKRQLWEFTLTYLLMERGSQFNKKAYLSSLVRQMAGHANIRYDELLDSLTTMLESMATPQVLRAEMLALLGELQAGLGLKVQSQKIQEESRGKDENNTEKTIQPLLEDVMEPWPVQQDEPIEERLVQCLSTDGGVSSREASWLVRVIERLLEQQPDRLQQLLRTSFDNRVSIARLIDFLPETLLIRLLFLLRPNEYYLVQECAESLANACYTKESLFELAQLRKLKWAFIFRYILEESRRFHVPSFVSRFVDYLAEQANGLPVTEFHVLLSRQLALNTLPSTRERHLKIIHVISHMDKERTQPERQTVHDGSSDRAYSLEEEKEEWGEEVYITNAGQVLAAPYLPRLFTMLHLTEASAFKSREAAERAIHVIQFMVNECTSSPEYQLVLNKILCGVETGMPIVRDISLSDQEQATIEGLIEAMIQHWKVIGSTSVAGFRESFLQREGKLYLKDHAWHLLVEPRPFDMLLDQVPWSFSTIKFPWMERILYVEWR